MMKVKITDPQTLKSIATSDVTTYLRNRFLENIDTWGNKATIWRLDNSTEHELIVPNSDDSSDYALRISEILSTLAIIEERSETLIYLDIVTENEDLVRFRALHPEADDGSIPLPDGLKLIQGAYNLLISAATVVDDKRPFLPNRKPNDAMKYVQQARIGQTELGSYVIVVRSDVHINIDSNENNNSNLPYGRRVLRTLANALLSLQSMTYNLDPAQVGEQALEDEIEEFVRLGGSIDLCQAVEMLNDSAQEQEVEISFTWSSRLPTEQRMYPTIMITSKMAKLTTRLSEAIRRQLISTEKSVTGNIIRLARGVEDYIANVTVEGLIDDRRRRVRLHIRDEVDHGMVIKAYQMGVQVMVKGVLVKQGNLTLLDQYYDLQLMEDNE